MKVTIIRASGLPINVDKSREYDYEASGGEHRFSEKHQKWLIETFGPTQIEMELINLDELRIIMDSYGSEIVLGKAKEWKELNTEYLLTIYDDYLE